ncbi:MAG: DUF3011 domain-containing protein [Rhodocyclaceae bacterium]
MRHTLSARILTTLLCFSLLPVPAFSGEQTVHCESKNYRYQYCSADTDYSVKLERQSSSTRCRQGDNWGYDRHGVWVDRGCAADFRVGRRHNDRDRDRDRDHDKSAVAAGAAIAGIAILAAVAANRDRSKDDVASWAVGTFKAYDEYEGSDIEITVLPGGSVSGNAGRNRFSGSLSGNRLEAGRHRFSIERSDNGFLATDESNSRHRVQFQRSGSGY